MSATDCNKMREEKGGSAAQALYYGVFGEWPERDVTEAELPELKAILAEALSAYDEEVLERRLGLFGPAETLQEIATSRGVTTEPIRQHEARALRKLRLPVTAKRIRKLFEKAAAV